MRRVFFALEPTAELALSIAGWRDRALQCDGRPVPPSNFHLTLAFVGELPERPLQRLCESVDLWLDSELPAGGGLQLDRLGFWQPPGIFWLGCSAWGEQLTRLASKLRGLASGAGARRDRKAFQPHISLFRGCAGAPPAPAQLPDFTLSYDHFSLYESRRGRAGVSYHALQDWPLAD